MTRYVKHSYGLVVGSGNIFYLISADGIFRDHYKSIVIPNPLGCRNKILSAYGYSISSYAQQLVWTRYDFEGENYGRYVIDSKISYWLETNIGRRTDKWDARKFNHTNSEPVFFKNRNDAVKFVKFLKSVIKEMYFD